MKTIAKIFLVVWTLIVVGGGLYLLIYSLTKDPEMTMIVILLACAFVFLVYGPFWALDQLTK